MDKLQIENELKTIEGWTYNLESNSIEKVFTFKSYLKNINFVNVVAHLANKYNHHPEILITFNSCKIMITTHDENSITEKDFNLARAINEI